MKSQLSKTMEEVDCNLCFLFHPSWARCLATRRVFVIVYGILSIVQGMGFFYIVSVMTTMELHFQLPSEIFGLIFSIGEVTVVFVGLIVGLLVGVNCHRPLAIGITMAFMGIGSHLFALPYYLYGSPKPLNETYSSDNFNDNSLLCVELQENSSLMLNKNMTDCKTSLEAPDVSVGAILALLLLSYTLSNVGAVALYVIGTPFLDDNVQSKNSAMYVASMCSFRSLGPILGTVLGSMCLTVYVDPSNPPWFDANDVRWVGAWWIGFIIMGFLSFISAFVVAQFPKRLPSKGITPAMKMKECELELMPKNEHSENQNPLANLPSFREIRISLLRILVNSLLWFRVLSETFTWFAYEGYMLYLPKYLEHEFQMTASSAGMWSGCSIIVPALFGNLIVGYVITRFKLDVRQCALGVAIAKIVEAISMIALMFIRCEESHLLGSGSSQPVCEWKNCDCSSAILSPVCGTDGFSYFSACHAGCSVLNSSTYDGGNVFNNCSCVIGDGVAEAKLCDTDCSSNILYLIIVAFTKFGISIEIVAGTLFTLRVVEPRDKTLANGFLCAVLGIFTFIPCPLVFSSAVDWSCLVWSQQCGRQGACDVYDMEKFRTILHVAPIALISIGAFWDMLFWHHCKDKMSLYTDDDDIDERNEVEVKKPIKRKL